ncbi:hypothetical protein ABC347_04105 [Sphingomonas sp. 1P06PA]|uniref:tetratricopeptide repeat protein n=1 Tax=Sphingomonas sp. 1P06PA TaxID=554121 RepID=UPI0039A70630
MATAAGRTLPLGRIALALAAIIALIAVAIAVLRQREDAAAPVAAAAPAGDLRTMIAALETRLKANPNDAQGWRMLAIGYFETARYGDSVNAYKRLTALTPADGSAWSALGEAMVLAGEGGVDAQAAQAFQTALRQDAKDARARYFLAVRKDMGGDHKGAVEDWIALLNDSPADAPYAESVRQITQQVASANKIDIAGRLPAAAPAAIAPPVATGSGAAVASAGIPGPTRDQLAAASSLPPSQQDAMVKQMVDGLAAKLTANPKDPDGWIRLMRARMVLNDAPGATAALAAARAANPADAAKLADAARTLGVPGA